MKRVKASLVIGLMGMAVVGLILIQIYWITKAIEVNKEIFARHVNDALQNVATRLERKDAFAFVSKKSFKDTAIIPDVGVKTLSPGALKPYLLRDLRRLKYADYALTDVPIEFTDAYRQVPSARNFSEEPAFDPENIDDYSLDSLLMGNDFGEIENIGNLKTTEEVNKVLKKKYLLQKLAVDLAQRKNPLEQRLNFEQLNEMLQNELENRNISLDYKYGIYQQKNKNFIYKSPEAAAPELENSVYKAQLFPNDFFLEPNFIKLYFPKQNLHIILRISTILASSLVFIIIIILSFLWMMRSFLEQKKLSEIKTDFINNMTHEFKTPITTISLASEALKDADVQKDENRLNRLAIMIQEENKRLEGQVERVLQVARLQKGELRLNKETVDIHQIINKAILQAGLLLEDKKVELTCNLLARRTMVEGDKVHLANIIYNLLDNAIKYAKEKPEISINSYNTNDKIVVEIADNGIGMTTEEQKHIFEQFYRVPTGNVHNVKGFGLGLSYVRTMLAAHNGNISVKSAPGKGSIFTFYLEN